MAVVAEVSNDEANDLVDDILLRDEFLTAREPGFFERSVERVFDFIGDIFEELFGGLFGGAGGAAGNLLAIILLSLAGGVLLFAIYKAITGRTPKDDLDERGARIVFDEVVEPDQLRAEFARQRASSNWRAAVIAGFRLAVVGLIDSNIAREVAGATTGDFARAVERRRPELLGKYRSAAGAFERAFYSDLEIDESDVAMVASLLGELSLAGVS
ncbi:MAG: hypothetical protein ACI81L_001909 [Verrucomicrobiales bacterium]